MLFSGSYKSRILISTAVDSFICIRPIAQFADFAFILYCDSWYMTALSNFQSQPSVLPCAMSRESYGLLSDIAGIKRFLNREYSGDCLKRASQCTRFKCQGFFSLSITQTSPIEVICGVMNSLPVSDLGIESLIIFMARISVWWFSNKSHTGNESFAGMYCRAIPCVFEKCCITS